MLSTDFSHGWNSRAGNHMYRIVCKFPLMDEHVFLFSIDGVLFNNLPRRRGDKTLKQSVISASTSDPIKEATTSGFASNKNSDADGTINSKKKKKKSTTKNSDTSISNSNSKPMTDNQLEVNGVAADDFNRAFFQSPKDVNATAFGGGSSTDNFDPFSFNSQADFDPFTDSSKAPPASSAVFKEIDSSSDWLNSNHSRNDNNNVSVSGNNSQTHNHHSNTVSNSDFLDDPFQQFPQQQQPQQRKSVIDDFAGMSFDVSVNPVPPQAIVTAKKPVMFNPYDKIQAPQLQQQPQSVFIAPTGTKVGTSATKPMIDPFSGTYSRPAASGSDPFSSLTTKTSTSKPPSTPVSSSVTATVTATNTSVVKQQRVNPFDMPIQKSSISISSMSASSNALPRSTPATRAQEVKPKTSLDTLDWLS